MEQGYVYHAIGTVPFPTAVFSRWNLVKEASSTMSKADKGQKKNIGKAEDDDDNEAATTIVDLGDDRQAIGLGIEWPGSEVLEDGDDDTAATSSSSGSNNIVWVYGIHLNHVEYCKGQRCTEMVKFLNHIQQTHSKTLVGGQHDNDDDDDVANNDVPIILAGDFNQQRPNDYRPDEWTKIASSKELRDEASVCDGVDELLHQHGFACVYDDDDHKNNNNNDKHKQRTITTTNNMNWSGPLPPATHWSGTVVDYAYSRGGPNFRNVGTYVSPSALSDHRLVITDWTMN